MKRLAWMWSPVTLIKTPYLKHQPRALGPAANPNGSTRTNLEPEMFSMLRRRPFTLKIRSVNASWFDRYTWLTLCETRNVLFCHCCVEAHSQRLIAFFRKGDDAFVSSDFSWWKKDLERFSKHKTSNVHSGDVMKLQNVASVHISAVLDDKRKEQQLQQYIANVTKAPLFCTLPCSSRISSSWS